jgi:two-component system alkaline phosphatase synthesis response regulator PhoP
MSLSTYSIMPAQRNRSVVSNRILIVEDDTDIAELIATNLTRENYQVKAVVHGYEAIDMVREYQPDLILLDIMLPDESGFEVCKVLKKDPMTERIPVIVVSAKGEDADVVTGLELGADDYIVKPFSPSVLVARVNRILKKRSEEMVAGDEIIRIHDLIMNRVKHEVKIGEQRIDLTLSEFRLLQILSRKPGRVYSRSQLVAGIRGDEYMVSGRSMDVLIVSLRRKLGRIGEKIITVRGVGYKMLED